MTLLRLQGRPANRTVCKAVPFIRYTLRLNIFCIGNQALNITIFGSGYVGLVTAACFADVGNDVLCVDVDARKIAKSSILPLEMTPFGTGSSCAGMCWAAWVMPTVCGSLGCFRKTNICGCNRRCVAHCKRCRGAMNKPAGRPGAGQTYKSFASGIHDE